MRSEPLSWTLLFGRPLRLLHENPPPCSPAAQSQRPGQGRDTRTSLGGITKAALDKTVAAAALVLAAPLMAIVAILIRVSDGGPAIYGHLRVGANGRPFHCYKFRTMVQNGEEVLKVHLAANPDSASEWSATRKLRNDPRITRIGRVLRRSSLDELPQLFNVLRGQMSCVGPRPVVMDELARYGENAADYLAARPGMTGLWQICGRSRLGYAERIQLDTLYVRRWSLALDLVILLKTIPAVLRVQDAS